MPKARFNTLVSWSFSVYQQYLKCPLSVCFNKIQRIRIREEEKAPALVRGDMVHTAADTFIGTSGTPKIIPELASVKPMLTMLRKAKARTEQEWAFTREWAPTGWFDKDAWLRVKTDACADTKEPPTVLIVDWKTGKMHSEHRQQRSLYALGGLQLVQIGALAGGSKKTVLTAQHVYTDTGQSATEEFTPKHLAPLKREWLARIKEMMADTQFPAITGRHCEWCKYAKSKGGPCPEKM